MADRRPALAAGLALVLTMAGSAVISPSLAQDGATTASSTSLPISSDLRVVVLRGREIAVEARAKQGDSYASLGSRLAGGQGVADALSAWNDGVEVEEGVWIQAPLALLSDEYRSLALRSLFPGDRRDGDEVERMRGALRRPLRMAERLGIPRFELA